MFSEARDIWPKPLMGWLLVMTLLMCPKKTGTRVPVPNLFSDP